MFYGAGLPILFPVAAFSYFIFYATERYGLAYTYEMPPTMDDRLPKYAVRMMSFAPLLLLMSGYWMYSNLQIFENVVSSIDKQGDQMLTGHTWSTLDTINPATPMMLIVIPYLTIIIGLRFFYPMLQKSGFTISR